MHKITNRPFSPWLWLTIGFVALILLFSWWLFDNYSAQAQVVGDEVAGRVFISSVSPAQPSTTATFSGSGVGGYWQRGRVICADGLGIGKFVQRLGTTSPPEPAPPPSEFHNHPTDPVTLEQGMPFYNTTFEIDGAVWGSYPLTALGDWENQNAGCPEVGVFDPMDYGFSFSVNISSLSVGTHTIRVSVWDEATDRVIFSNPFTFTKAAPPDFNLSCSPSSFPVDQNGSAAYTVSVTSTNGFSGPVSAQVTSGLHSTMGTSGTTINVPPNGTSSGVVTVSTTLATPPGTYPLIITATGGGVSKTCPVNLVVSQVFGPSVELVANPISVNPGGTTTLTWDVNNATSCTRSTTPAIAGWSGSTPASDGSQEGVAVSGPFTDYTLTCSKSGFPDAASTVRVTVNAAPAFSISSALTFTAFRGDPTLPAAKTFTITNTGNVDLNFSLSTNRLWVALGVSSIFVPAGQNRTVNVGPNTTDTAGLSSNPDTASVTFNSNSSAGSQPGNVTYTLTTLALACAPNPITFNPATQPGSPTFTVTASSANPTGASKAISLSATSNPAGLSFSFSPTSVNAAGPTASTVTISGYQPNTTYAINVNGAATGATVTGCSTNLNVGAAAVRSFTATPSLTFSAAQNAATSTVTPSPSQNVTLTNTGNQSLTITQSANPAWFSTSPNLVSSPVTIAPGASTQVTVTITSTSAAPPGVSQALTFSDTAAVGPATPRSTTVTLNTSATPPPTTYSLNCAPNPITFNPSSQPPPPQFTVTASSANPSGANRSITLSATSNPAGLSFSFSPNPINPAGPTSSTVFISGYANNTNYTINVSGSSTGVTINGCSTILNVGGGSGPSPVSVTAQCASSNSGPFTSGPNASCTLPASGATGFIRWTASPSSATCNTTANTAGDSMTTTSSAANPVSPVQTSGLNNPPVNHNFTVTCNSGATNYALASDGSVASASSTVNSNFLPSGANNGDRRGVNWNTPTGGGWNDGTWASFPDWLQIDFPGTRTINEIDVFTVQDNVTNPSEPTETMTFTLYGATAYTVQYWSSGGAWVTVPGGNITGNNRVWRKLTFSDITTSRIRVQVNGAIDGYSRLVEVEAWGSSTASDSVTFGVPAPGSYDLSDSAKHAIAVNQPTLSLSQLESANTNPCDGQGRVLDPTYNYKEGDVVTFALNICNTGDGDLVFAGAGTNDYSIVLTDTLGNLARPTAGWNAQASCGNDCQLTGVDDTSQPGKIIFTLQVRSGGSNRLISQNGFWALFFNAVPRAPVGGTQPYYYFTNCVTNMTVNNAPAPDDVYLNTAGQPFDIPGFCLQALFSKAGTAPDRREVAP